MLRSELPRHPFSGADRVMTGWLTISSGQYSAAGTKPENQDFHGMLLPGGDDLVTKGIAAAIADGISTSPLGASAAQTAVKSFLTDYYCTSGAWSVRNSGQRVIAATNSWMHSQNRLAGPLSDDTREAGLICTLTALILKSRSAHIFHVGDGQVARIVGGDIEVLTDAHRVSAGGGRSYLGRAMGVNRHVEIDYRQVPLQPGDLFLMTTDGVHEVLTARQIGTIVGEARSLGHAAHALCHAAMAAGSEDNLTAQLIRIETVPPGDVIDLVGEQAALPPAPHLEAGQDFEGYRIVRRLYGGARSHVYLARDMIGGARVCIKVPATEHGDDPAQMAALLLEEWVMRRVTHQNLLGAPPETNRPRRFVYSVSSFIEGQTLDEWMHNHPDPDLAAVRDIVRQIASGLLALHRKEMVHRDLRPENVLIDADGTVTIIDFGSVEVAGLEEIAPGTAGEAAFAGTVQFSAPEIYRGEASSAQSDIYSLGVIAYRLLTGDLPYGPRIANAHTRRAQAKFKYRPVGETRDTFPAWMDAAIARACAIDPAHRYEELSEFTYDLSHPSPDIAARMRPLMQRGSVRDWRMIALVLAAMLALSILTRPDIGLHFAHVQQETAHDDQG